MRRAELVGRFGSGTALLGCLVVITACSTAPSTSFKVLPREIAVEDDGSTVIAGGRWRALEKRDLSTITTVNAVTVRCQRAANRCYESIAMVITPSDNLQSNGLVMSIAFDYEVVSWAGGRISATNQTRASDQFLEIDVNASVVGRISKETAARGAKTSEPPPERWVLE